MAVASKKESFPYEFGGPWGVLLTTFSLPVTVMVLIRWSVVGSLDWTIFTHFLHHADVPFWAKVKRSPVFCPSCDEDPSILYKCAAALIAWFLFQVVLERFLPFVSVQGAPVNGNDQNRLAYRINGHLAFWVTFLVFTLGYPVYDSVNGVWQPGSFPLQLVYDYTSELALCSIVLSFGLALFLYLDSFRGEKILAAGGNSGQPIYDFFIGRELNPRIFDFDWKEFSELRPGLIGWLILNASCATQQRATLGYISGSMILLNVFQGIYVWDALYQERSILTTMDITHDGFGLMLVFGDLCWVPFTYSLQARYLVHHDPRLSTVAQLGILALHMCGYLIFRGANSQKDTFRSNPLDPRVAHLTYLQTKHGTKLLTSGWWGMARKVNYTGDWIMGLTWCLVCGWSSLVPYFYSVYFGILLIHRSIRDDHLCQKKYGDDWLAYKKLVPFRFVPGVV